MFYKALGTTWSTLAFTAWTLMFLSCGDDKKNKHQETSDLRSEISSQITQLETRQSDAIKKRQFKEALDAGVDLHSKKEELDALDYNSSIYSAKVKEIENRHTYMKQMVSEVKADQKNEELKCSPENKDCKDISYTLTDLRKRFDVIEYMKPRDKWLHYIEYKHKNLQLNHLDNPKNLEEINKSHANVLSVHSNVSMKIDSDENCKENKKCQALMGSIDSLRAEQREAYEKGDYIAANHASVKISLAEDLLSHYQSGKIDQEAEHRIKAQHDLLVDIVDGNRAAYNELEKNEVKKVSDDFGQLYIKADNSDHSIAVKGQQPWAAYWYPFRTKYMFEGEDAPLRKFDEFLASAGREQGAAEWERKRQENQSWESSDGLCDAWAIAASLAPEPRQPLHVSGITFTPSVLKGLLIQKYANFEKVRYGIPYKGYIDTDGLAQDLRPEAFHKIVTSLLAKNVAPVVDTDPNFPIWNMPLYKYQWKVSEDPDYENAVLVTATASYVKFRKMPSSELTDYFGRGSDAFLTIYKYRLFLDPTSSNKNGKRVVYGEWLKDRNASTYPDTVFYARKSTKPTPRNEVVAKNLDLLDALLDLAK